MLIGQLAIVTLFGAILGGITLSGAYSFTNYKCKFHIYTQNIFQTQTKTEITYKKKYVRTIVETSAMQIPTQEPLERKIRQSQLRQNTSKPDASIITVALTRPPRDALHDTRSQRNFLLGSCIPEGF